MEQAIEVQEFKVLSDEEIIYYIRQKDNRALEFMMNKYKRLVEKKSKSYFLMGAGKEDLFQEGMIGLFKAIRDYNSKKEASFFSFAELCITRQMITAVKTSMRQKHMPLNGYISLNKSASTTEEEDKGELLDILPAHPRENPESVVIAKETVHLLENELSEALSSFEKEVLQLHIEGVDYVEIGKRLEKPSKSIDNALQRIKKKVGKIIKEKVNNS